MSWNPYRVRSAPDGFHLTHSWWVAVPDGGGCIDWDEETEEVEDLVYTNVEDARAEADLRNENWHEADRLRREHMRKN